MDKQLAVWGVSILSKATMENEWVVCVQCIGHSRQALEKCLGTVET